MKLKFKFRFAISCDVKCSRKGEKLPRNCAHGDGFSPCFSCQLNPSRDGHVNPTLFAWICQKRINKLVSESESDGVERANGERSLNWRRCNEISSRHSRTHQVDKPVKSISVFSPKLAAQSI
jgi:hypothetical protein